MAIADNANQTNDSWTWGGLLGDFKKGGQKFLDFLQSPDAITLGMGILRSQSPNLLGALTEGYDSYRGEKQKEAQQKMQQQMLAMDAMLKSAKARKYQQEEEAQKVLVERLRSRMGLGGGTPTPGERMPTFAPFPGTGGGALTQTGGLPPAREQTIPGEDTSGMSLDARIAAGYAPTEEEIQQAITQEGRGSSGQQVAVPGASQQIAQQAISRPQATSQIMNTDDLAGDVALAYAAGNPMMAKAFEALMPKEREMKFIPVMGPEGKGVYAGIDPVSGQARILPLQPYEKPEQDKSLTKIIEAEGERLVDFRKDLTNLANTYKGQANKSRQILALLDKNPNLRSGPGSETSTKIKNLLGIKGDEGAQELFQKLVGQLVPEATGMLREGGVSRITQGELMNLVPNLTATMMNSPEGIRAITTLTVKLDPIVQNAKKEAAELEREYRRVYKETGRPPFNLEQAYYEIEEILNKRIESETKQFASELAQLGAR